MAKHKLEKRIVLDGVKYAVAFVLIAAVLLLSAFAIREATRTVNEEWHVGGTQLEWSLDSAEIVDGRLSVKGAAYCLGDEQWSAYRRKSIWLVNERTQVVKRYVAEDAIKYLKLEGIDENAYRYCGFAASVDLTKGFDDGDSYEVLLAYQNNGKTSIESTGMIINADLELIGGKSQPVKAS